MAKLPDDAWAKNVCRYGKKEKCCRYLLMGTGGWECGVGRIPPSMYERFTAKSVNCSGPPDFKEHVSG